MVDKPLADAGVNPHDLGSTGELAGSSARPGVRQIDP
jgi:hypothetical protein